MQLLHERIYGAGTGRRFLRGDYLDDLPRAVHERIKVEIARRTPEIQAITLVQLRLRYLR